MIGEIITFIVVVICAPSECIQGHIPLANITLTQCFANDPRIPKDALERWQVYDAGEPKYLPVLAWCEQGRTRPAYRRTCSNPAVVGGTSNPIDEIRKTAHLCVGRTILDDAESQTVRN